MSLCDIEWMGFTEFLEVIFKFIIKLAFFNDCHKRHIRHIGHVRQSLYANYTQYPIMPTKARTKLVFITLTLTQKLIKRSPFDTALLTVCDMCNRLIADETNQ